MDTKKKISLLENYYFEEEEGQLYIVNKENNIKQLHINPFILYFFETMKKSSSISEACEILSRKFAVSYQKIEKKVSTMLSRMNGVVELVDSNTDIKTNIVNKSKNARIEKMTSFNPAIMKSPIPDKIALAITNDCYRGCVYCCVGANKIDTNCKSANTFDIKLFKRIVEEAETLKVPFLEISGGDPFTIENIFDYMNIIGTIRSLPWAMSTKSYISKETAQKLKCFFKNKPNAMFQISLDSCDENVVDKMINCKGGYNEILESIKNLLEVDMKFTVRCVITSINIESVPEYIVKLVNLGVKKIGFSHYTFSGYRHHHGLYPTEEQLKVLSEKITHSLNYAKSKNVEVQYTEKPSLLRFDLVDSMEERDQLRNVCGGTKSSLEIRVDGKAVFCERLSFLDEMIIGDLNYCTIMDVWNSKELDKWEKPFKSRYEDTECYNCDSFETCYSKRCYVRCYLASGKCFDKDPLCKYGDINCKDVY